MKVSKAQVQENRAHIVETAAGLFRERGFDGVGIADLMGAAGFTHGGFYKHFTSKADLMREAAAHALAQTAQASGGLSLDDFIQAYLSRGHRDARASGCAMAALGGDAARQPAEVQAVFSEGIEASLASFLRQRALSDAGAPHAAREQAINVLAHAVGALVLSRACPDDAPLADEILDTCRQHLLESLRPA